MTHSRWSTRPRRNYLGIRTLHLYLGLFVSPFVLLYALTAIFFVHAWLPWGGVGSGVPRTRTVPVSVQADSSSLDMAEQVRAQIGVAGEIDYVNRDAEAQRLSFPIHSPGRRASVTVDLRTGLAQVEERGTGVWDALVWLHKMPGPHNAAIRGNWAITRAWRWFSDATVYLLLFLSASGVYLWSVIRAERRAGLLCLGGGALTFVLLLLAIVG
jgi:hypothetical protein